MVLPLCRRHEVSRVSRLPHAYNYSCPTPLFSPSFSALYVVCKLSFHLDNYTKRARHSNDCPRAQGTSRTTSTSAKRTTQTRPSGLCSTLAWVHTVGLLLPLLVSLACALRTLAERNVSHSMGDDVDHIRDRGPDGLRARRHRRVQAHPRRNVRRSG